MEKLAILDKTKTFFKTKKEHFLTAFIVLIIFNIMLALNGCFPYGKQTVAMGDSLVQIGAFIGHIFNVFQGEATLFYTNNLAGGVEVFSTIEYMLLNPFYIIALLGGENNIYFMLNFSMMFMFVFNAVVFIWFAKKHFKNVKSVTRIMLAVLFAFSPYVAANFCFMTWLIYPALLLLLVDKFLNLVENGKILGFVVMTVWYVCNCFSVGVGSTIILLVLFSAYIFFTKEKEERKPLFVRLVVAYVISVLAAMVVLFPALMAFINIESRASIFSGFFDDAYNNQTITKIAYLMLPVAFVVFAAFHLIKSDKKEGKNKFFIFAIIFAAVILLFGMVTDLFMGGESNGFYLRFGFVYENILFVLALEFFEKQHEIQTKEEKPFFVYLVSLATLALIMVFVFGLWVYLTLTKFSKGLKTLFISSGFSWSMMFVIICVVALMISTYFIRKKGFVSKKVFNGFMAFSVVITMLLNLITVGFGIGASYDFDALKKQTSMLDVNSKIKINSNNLEDRHINSLNLNVKNASFFSSLLSSEMRESYEKLGFLNGAVSVETINSNMLIDSLYGQKYVVSYTEIDRPYLKLVSRSEDYLVYENTLATTGAVVLDEDFSYDDDLSVYGNYEKLKESLGVEGKLFEELEINGESVELDDRYCKFATKYEYSATKNTLLQINKKLLTFDRKEDVDLIEYYNKTFSNKIAFYVEASSEFADSEMIYVEAGKTIEFYVVGVGSKSDSTDETIKFNAIDYDVAEKVCKEFQARDVQISYAKNGYQVDLSGRAGKLVVFNIDLDGMRYKINGKSIDADHEFGYFTAFEVNESTKVIKATYVFPHIVSWIVVGFVAILLIVLIVILYKKTGFKFLEKIIHPVFIVANCCILLVFVGFGVILTIFKIIL